jgi:hypothetical protein
MFLACRGWAGCIAFWWRAIESREPCAMRKTGNWLAWVLAAAMVLQPMQTFACLCRTSCSASAAAVATRKGCCHKAGGAFNSSQSHGLTAKCSAAGERHCCCGGPNAGPCTCKTHASKIPGATLPQRILSDDLAVSTLCVHCAATDVVRDLRLPWALDYLPASLAASDRCILLCRLLF